MASTSSSVRFGSWWKSRTDAGPGELAEPHGVVHGRVAEVGHGRQLGGGVLGVVDQEVDAVGQRQRGVVVRPPAVRARARAPIGPWSDR